MIRPSSSFLGSSLIFRTARQFPLLQCSEEPFHKCCIEAGKQITWGGGRRSFLGTNMSDALGLPESLASVSPFDNEQKRKEIIKDPTLKEEERKHAQEIRAQQMHDIDVRVKQGELIAKKQWFRNATVCGAVIATLIPAMFNFAEFEIKSMQEREKTIRLKVALEAEQAITNTKAAVGLYQSEFIKNEDPEKAQRLLKIIAELSPDLKASPSVLQVMRSIQTLPDKDN
jgi:hypothetical protein